MSEVPLHDYFNRLLPLQESIARLTSARDLVHHHLGNGAAAVSFCLRRDGKTPEEVSDFTEKAAEIVRKSRGAASDTLKNVLADAARLDTTNTNLMLLAAAPERLTRANYEGLADLQKKVDAETPAIVEGLRKIRIETEVEILCLAGYVPADFKLLPSG